MSNIGTMIQSAAIMWHVYHLTHSSLNVGLMGLVRVGPLLTFSLFGGVLADQVDRRTLLLVTQAGMAVLAGALSYITLTGRDTIGAIYLVVGLSAVARAFNGPARQAIMANLVPAEDFANAASINGIVWRLSDVSGPIVAGFLIAWKGVGAVSGLAACYLLNAASFVAVIIAIWLLPKNLSQSGKRVRNPREVIESIREGFTFVRGTRVLRSAMIVDFWGTFLSGADALLPAFAASILHLDARGYGVLAAASGTGAFLAAGALAWLPTVRRQGRLVITMIGLYGAATVFFGLSPNLASAVFFLALTGASDMISTVLRQTIRQLTTPDFMRGRMSSIASMFQISGPQLGDFEAGALASGIGERGSIVTGGVGCIMVALWYWMRGRALKEYVHQVEAVSV